MEAGDFSFLMGENFVWMCTVYSGYEWVVIEFTFDYMYCPFGTSTFFYMNKKSKVASTAAAFNLYYWTIPRD